MTSWVPIGTPGHLRDTSILYIHLKLNQLSTFATRMPGSPGKGRGKLLTFGVLDKEHSSINSFRNGALASRSFRLGPLGPLGSEWESGYEDRDLVWFVVFPPNRPAKFRRIGLRIWGLGWV
jgi:hypothetical protein